MVGHLPLSASVTSARTDLSAGRTENPAPAGSKLSTVAAHHRQPDALRQPGHDLASQRASWTGLPPPEASSYLLIRGERVAVPFPTVCFDRHRSVAIDAPLPTKLWARNLLRTAWSAACTLASPAALRASQPRQLLEPARLRSLWTQGNLQLCAVPRQDPTGAGIDAVVLHWDGCNSSAQMYQVLRTLGLSAHLLVDSDATVYQLMDLAEMKAYHAGWINERSIGIEFNNPVDPSSVAPGDAPRQLVCELVPHQGRLMSIHLDFTPAQRQRCLQILDVLHHHFAVPRALPPSIDAHGEEAVPGLMSRQFRGVCGHYHVGTHKVDPGLSFWPLIRRHWAPTEAGGQTAASTPESNEACAIRAA